MSLDAIQPEISDFSLCLWIGGKLQDLHQNKEIDKGRTGLRLCYNTASLCEYVPILSMHSDDPDQGQLMLQP